MTPSNGRSCGAGRRGSILGLSPGGSFWERGRLDSRNSGFVVTPTAFESTTVTGILVDDSEPIGGATVRSSFGPSVVTDAAGRVHQGRRTSDR